VECPELFERFLEAFDFFFFFFNFKFDLDRNISCHLSNIYLRFYGKHLQMKPQSPYFSFVFEVSGVTF
jgi:hypothetical protein